MRNLVKKTLEKISRINRYSPAHHAVDADCQHAIEQLRERGFVVLDHLVGTPAFKKLQQEIVNRIEHKIDLSFPCLAQSKIDPEKHHDLIEKSFLAQPSVLAASGLTFDRNDVKSYQQMVKDYNPSTLTVPMVSDRHFYDCWLDDKVMAVIEGYMGFVPELTEAYVRRNFPAQFRVMNHNWHRDTNHPDFLVKAFVFFTDCDLETGAHHYIAGSIQDRRFRDKVYYSDDEIHSVWPLDAEDHITSTVPAGTIIIEDTRGLHKAGIPKKAFRDLGYAVFTPPNYFRPNKSYYKINKDVYQSLSFKQQRYIPSANIS